MNVSDAYEAILTCVVFDNDYNFEDILHIGIAHSKEEASNLLLNDIWRVMEEFGNDKCSMENARSEYDEPVTIVHTEGELIHHWHYYLQFLKDHRRS